MKLLVKMVAILALFGTIVPAFTVFYGFMDLETCKTIMASSAILWLLTGPLLMTDKSKAAEESL